MSEPRTEAGRQLLAGMPSQRDRGLRAAIIAVEAEAATPAGRAEALLRAIEGQRDEAEARAAEIAALRERVTAWAGSVRRLITVAPISAIIEETGLPQQGHSTPPERAAIRAAALEIVDQWLRRDLAAARLASEPPEGANLADAELQVDNPHG